MEECQFKFNSVSENQVWKVILNIDEIAGDVPAGILKGCVDSYISVLTRTLNTSLERGCFHTNL